MRTKFIIIVFLVCSAHGYAQVFSGEKLSRQERKALRIERQAERGKEVTQLVKDTVFILEATRAGGQNVNPNLYFVYLEKNMVVIQTGLMNETDVKRWSGITMEGKIRNMKIKKSRNGASTSINGILTTSLGMFRIDFRISSSGWATASLKNINNTDKIDFSGLITSPLRSTVYKGGPVY